MAKTTNTYHDLEVPGLLADTVEFNQDFGAFKNNIGDGMATLAAKLAGGNAVGGTSANSNAGKIIGANNGARYGRIIGFEAGDDADLVFQDHPADPTTGTDKFDIGYDDSADAFAISAGATLSTTGIVVDTSGNVGFGIDPTNAFDLYRATGAVTFQIESNDDAVNLILDGVKTSNAVFGTIEFENAGDSVASIRATRDDANDAASLSFWTQVASGALTERLFIDSTGTVGIGIATPDGTLHVHTATAGSVDAFANAKDLVVENSGNGGISILVPDASLARIGFGSPTDSLGSQIYYQQSTATLTIGTHLAGGIIKFQTAIGIDAVQISNDDMELTSNNATTNFVIDNTAGDGDPQLAFALSGVRKFTWGVDDGDSDKLKLGTTAPGTSTFITIDSAGLVTLAGSLTAGDATSDVFNASGYLEHQSARFQSFSLEINNNAGTLRHRISNGAYNGAAATFDDKITGATVSWNNTPLVAAAVDFTAGVGIENANPRFVLFNTVSQTSAAIMRYATVIIANSTSTAVLVSPYVRSIDVNGTTRVWLGLYFTDNTGANFDINTTNIAAGKSIVVQILGFIL